VFHNRPTVFGIFLRLESVRTWRQGLGDMLDGALPTLFREPCSVFFFIHFKAAAWVFSNTILDSCIAITI
jgi:hypothetical protein